jgi:CRP-like cAMP-binding protein
MLKRRRFKVGETLIRENDIGETAYIIQKGRVRITKEVGGKSVQLAMIGPGGTVGEMSMIEDSPRSATATAIEATETDEIHHDDFYEALRSDPEVTVMLLKPIFERLREANATILRLSAEGGAAEAVPAQEPPPAVLLEGLTPKAEEALPSNPVRIETFPFRIGRVSHNPLVHNDLTIDDEMPWQVSRHHVVLVFENGRIGVMDRGSTLGASVDGERLGGPKGKPGPIFFEGDEGCLVLGTEKSPFRFQVVIEPRPT